MGRWDGDSGWRGLSDKESKPAKAPLQVLVGAGRCCNLRARKAGFSGTGGSYAA